MLHHHHHHHRLHPSMSAKWELSKYPTLLPPCKNQIPGGPVILSQSLTDATIGLVCWRSHSSLSTKMFPASLLRTLNRPSRAPNSSWQRSALLSCDSTKFQRIVKTTFAPYSLFLVSLSLAAVFHRRDNEQAPGLLRGRSHAGRGPGPHLWQ